VGEETADSRSAEPKRWSATPASAIPVPAIVNTKINTAAAEMVLRVI
jgi:hypothetical protein